MQRCWQLQQWRWASRLRRHECRSIDSLRVRCDDAVSRPLGKRARLALMSIEHSSGRPVPLLGWHRGHIKHRPAYDRLLISALRQSCLRGSLHRGRGFRTGKRLLVPQDAAPTGQRDSRAMDIIMLSRCKPGDDRLMFQRDQSTVIKPATTTSCSSHWQRMHCQTHNPDFSVA